MIAHIKPMLVSLLLALMVAPVTHAEPPPLVFAAASLREGLDAVLAQYRRDTGQEVRVSYAGTPTLARQIEAAAPAQLFLSADARWMDYLHERDLLVPGSRLDLLSNDLVIVASQCQPVVGASALRQAIPSWLGEHGRLALAHPDSVPAGRYGKAALQKYALWPTLQPRLVEVENVRLALRLAAMGEVPLALVYGSDALADRAVRICYRFEPGDHPPIRYPIAAIGGSGRDSAELLAYLRSTQAGELWTQHGFGFLGQSAAAVSE